MSSTAGKNVALAWQGPPDSCPLCPMVTVTITRTAARACWPLKMSLQKFLGWGSLQKSLDPRHRLSSVGLCMIALFIWFFTLIALNSVSTPRPFPIPSKNRSINQEARLETIAAMLGDRRWTREACLDHWAGGLDKLAFGKLAQKRVFLAMNVKDNEIGELSGPAFRFSYPRQCDL
jgi:hypothetical protein